MAKIKDERGEFFALIGIDAPFAVPSSVVHDVGNVAGGWNAFERVHKERAIGLAHFFARHSLGFGYNAPELVVARSMVGG